MRVTRGSAPAILQQAGYTPVIVKVVNESGGSQRLRIGSPQAGPVYAGMSRLSGQRMQQEHLRENENVEKRTDRFLDLEMFTAAPMTANLSGLEVEYAIALIYSSEPGRREATITFDVGQGTAGPGVPRRGAGAVRRQTRGRRQTERPRRRWHADDGPVSVRGCAGPRVSAAGEAAGAGPVLSEAHLSCARRGRAAAAWRADDVLRPRPRVPMDEADRHDPRCRTRRPRRGQRGHRRQTRTLGRSGRARPLQRRPSHPLGRVRALHLADRRRRSRRHVQTDQG